MDKISAGADIDHVAPSPPPDPSRQEAAFDLEQQRALTEVAARALLDGPLDDLYCCAVRALATSLGADSAALLTVSTTDVTVTAHHGLRHLDPLALQTDDQKTLQAVEGMGIDTADGANRGAVAGLLRREGHRFGVVVGFGSDPVQVLVVSRRDRAFEAPIGSLLRAVSRLLTLAGQRRQARDLAQRRLRQQQAAAALGQIALAADDPSVVMQEATRIVTEALGVGRCCVLERNGEYMALRAATGWPGVELGQNVPAKQIISSLVLRDNEPLIIDDLESDDRFTDSLLASRYPTGSLMVVPIMGPLHPVATLTVVSEKTVSYNEDDIAFMRSIANVIAMSMERGRTQNQLRLSIQELRKSAQDRSTLMAHIVEAQEEERQRIANDIHDDSVQVMTAVALRLATVRRRLGADHVDPMLVRLESDVRESIARLRHLMFMLNPPALDAHGLVAALHALLAQIGADNGIKYSLDSYLSIEPEPQARTIAYRIAQEAVTNACKHGRATRLDVVLGETGDGVFVEIRDDGTGFDPEQPNPNPPGHLGLMAMRERAEQSGGWWTVASEPGIGTTVRYCVGSEALRHRNQRRLSTMAGSADTIEATAS